MSRPSLFFPAFLLSLSASGAAFAQGTPSAQAPSVTPGVVRIHVHTADEVGDERELAERRESVTDVATALAANKKVLVVVAGEDQPDVALEVVGRGWTVPKVVIGMGPRPGQPPGAGVTPVRAVQLRVRLRVADRDPVDFSNRNAPLESNRGWKSAADDIAGQVEKWITAHRAEILAASRPK